LRSRILKSGLPVSVRDDTPFVIAGQSRIDPAEMMAIASDEPVAETERVVQKG
jgi:hypothetical protein